MGKRVPHAVVCLLSALQVHGMTTEVPHAVWVLIDRHARRPKITSPTLEVVRASGGALEHGVETRVIDGVTVQLTTPAKTVADCFRFRRQMSGPGPRRDRLDGALREYPLGLPALRRSTEVSRKGTQELPASANRQSVGQAQIPCIPFVTGLHSSVKTVRRPTKVTDVMGEIAKHLAAGTYRDSTHAVQRRNERGITRQEMLQVLRRGRHEKRKDEFKLEYNEWNYAIRGKTIDGRKLRVVVAFIEPGLLVITAIDLEGKD